MPIDLLYVRWLEARLVASVWLTRADELLESAELLRRRAGLKFKAAGIVVFDRVMCNELDRCGQRSGEQLKKERAC